MGIRRALGENISFFLGYATSKKDAHTLYRLLVVLLGVGALPLPGFLCLLLGRLG